MENSDKPKQEFYTSCNVISETFKAKTQSNKLIHKSQDDFIGKSLTISFNCNYVNPKLLKIAICSTTHLNAV